jgi:hypothetical protein
VKTELIRKVQWMGWLLRRTGPYVALEILLPGGTVFALMLYLVERRRLALRQGATPNRVDHLGRLAFRRGRALVNRVSALAGDLRDVVRLRATV